jgi:hypothetical protein
MTPCSLEDATSFSEKPATFIFMVENYASREEKPLGASAISHIISLVYCAIYSSFLKMEVA